MNTSIPDKLAAIKARADAEKTTTGLIHIAAQCISQTDVPRLIAEVERLREIFTQLQFRIAKQDEDEELLTLIDAAFDPKRSAL